MATMLPELILASYSWARRDHMVRLIRARPLSVSSARRTIGPSASLRMPTAAIFAVGTRNVILSLTKLMTNSSSLQPATSCSSIAMIWPTPWAGYTMNSLVLKPCRWVVFLAAVIPGVTPWPSALRRWGFASGGARRGRPGAAREVRPRVAGGAARRALPRAACEVLRRLAAEGLLAVFFDLDR